MGTQGLPQAGEAGRRDRPVFLMVTLFLLLLVHPAFEGKPFAALVLSAFFTLILVSSALAVMRQRRLFVAVCCLGLPWVVLNWAGNLVSLGPALDLLRLVVQTTFILFVVVVLVAKLLTTSTVTANTLCRAVSAYLLMGVAWAAMYGMLVLLDPNAFRTPSGDTSWAEYLYFSFTTLTTLGFGDITPVSPYARSLVMVEAVIGPMYLAVLIARLVAMHRPTSHTGAQ